MKSKRFFSCILSAMLAISCLGAFPISAEGEEAMAILPSNYESAQACHDTLADGYGCQCSNDTIAIALPEYVVSQWDYETSGTASCEFVSCNIYTEGQDINYNPESNTYTDMTNESVNIDDYYKLYDDMQNCYGYSVWLFKADSAGTLKFNFENIQTSESENLSCYGVGNTFGTYSYNFNITEENSAFTTEFIKSDLPTNLLEIEKAGTTFFIGDNRVAVLIHDVCLPYQWNYYINGTADLNFVEKVDIPRESPYDYFIPGNGSFDLYTFDISSTGILDLNFKFEGNESNGNPGEVIYDQHYNYIVSADDAGNFVLSDDTTTKLYGDATQDSRITVADVILINKYMAGMATLSAQQLAYCDVTGDGNVNNIDGLKIMKLIGGSISSLNPNA